MYTAMGFSPAFPAISRGPLRSSASSPFSSGNWHEFTVLLHEVRLAPSGKVRSGTLIVQFSAPGDRDAAALAAHRATPFDTSCVLDPLIPWLTT